MQTQKKILGVCSDGGHSIQLKIILKPLFDDADIFILTSSKQVFTSPFTKVDESLKDFNRSKAFLIPFSLIQCLFKIYRIKPNLIVSTGALPGVVCVLIARLLGIKTLWIDSIANSKKLSFSGKLAKKIAHKTLSQWPEVATQEQVGFAGRVLWFL